MTDAPLELVPGSFSIAVKWVDGTTQEQIDATKGYIAELNNSLIESGKQDIPDCIQSLTIFRE